MDLKYDADNMQKKKCHCHIMELAYYSRFTAIVAVGAVSVVVTLVCHEQQIAVGGEEVANMLVGIVPN